MISSELKMYPCAATNQCTSLPTFLKKKVPRNDGGSINRSIPIAKSTNRQRILSECGDVNSMISRGMRRHKNSSGSMDTVYCHCRGDITPAGLSSRRPFEYGSILSQIVLEKDATEKLPVIKDSSSKR